MFVDQWSAAGVDEYGRGFHAGEAPGVDHVAGAVGQRAVERDYVGGCEELVEAGFADSCGEAVGAFRCVGLDFHSECEGYAADGLADVAQPDYAECLSGQFVERAVNFYVDHLAVQDDSGTLPRAVLSSLDGRLRMFEDRLSSLLYKHSVELDMVMGLLADAYELTEEEMRRRRAEFRENF